MDKISDQQHLSNMKKSFERIMDVTKELSLDSFSDDLDKQDIVMFNFVLLSEEAKKLSVRFKDSNKNIPWIDIYGLRNKIVHDYGSVRLDVVFSTAKEDVPTIYKQLFKK